MSYLFKSFQTLLKINPAVQSQYLKVSCNNIFSWLKKVVKKMPTYTPTEVPYRKDLANGIKLRCDKLKNQTVGACTIMYQVGSRHECEDELGVTHFMRAGSTTDGFCFSGYAKGRYMLQQGGRLSVTSDRQTIAYTLRCPAAEFENLQGFFLDSGVRICYPEHQLEDVRRMVRHELHDRDPEAHVIDLLQKACWIGPLSNSVYCTKERIESINNETLTAFTGSSLVPEVCTVGSWGFPSVLVEKMAMIIGRSKKRRQKGDCAEKKSFHRSGYEFYDTGRGRDTYVAVGVPGVGTSNLRGMMILSILAAACGGGPARPTRLGQHRDRSNYQPLSNFTVNNPAITYRAFNISHSDMGIFGLLVKAPAKHVRCCAFNLVEFLSDIGKISELDIIYGKKRLIVGISVDSDDIETASYSLALQGTLKTTFQSGSDIIDSIQSVKPAEVQEMAGFLAKHYEKGPMGVAVLGDVEAAPHDHELRPILPKSDKYPVIASLFLTLDNNKLLLK